MTMTAGAVFLMWIGEQIDAYGIGNGISLLIMAGIVARMPDAGVQSLRPAFEHGIRLGTESGMDRIILLAVMFVVVVIWVVAITEGQRRIPIQSAKHVRGRRVMGGPAQSLPLRVNQAGVMPVVFASSILILPDVRLPAAQRVGETARAGLPVTSGLADAFHAVAAIIYNTCYIAADLLVLLLLGGRHLQPKDISEQPERLRQLHPRLSVRQANGRVPRTGADPHHLRRGRLPRHRRHHSQPGRALDGQSVHRRQLLRRHGAVHRRRVALDLVQKIDSHLVMRNYPGLLDSDS